MDARSVIVLIDSNTSVVQPVRESELARGTASGGGASSSPVPSALAAVEACD